MARPALRASTGEPAARHGPRTTAAGSPDATRSAWHWWQLQLLLLVLPITVGFVVLSAPGVAAQESEDSELGEVTELRIEPQDAVIRVDEQLELDAVATFADGSEQTVTQQAEWKTSNQEIAYVGVGQVVGSFGGEVTITATLQGQSATTTVTVDQPFLEWADELIDTFSIPFGWLDPALTWLNTEVAWLFNAIRWPFAQILDGVQAALLWLPWYVVVLAIGAIGWWRLGDWKTGLGFMAAMVLLGFLRDNIWELAMETLAMILTAIVACIVVGIPLGIWAASSDKVYGTVRPVLDAMQTIHPFVYLLPILILFGIGPVPGTLATFIFALPPVVRLTNLGIRQVPQETVEAARAFGSTDRQMLWEVQLPLARPVIMQGLNQSLMLAYSMVVIAALVAAGGLGKIILQALQTSDTPLAVTGGIGVLILAIILDRLSQSQTAAAEE